MSTEILNIFDYMILYGMLLIENIKRMRCICMVLTDEEAKQFYDLWIALLDFVNQKYTLIEELYGMTSPMGLPLKSVGLISSKLWEDKEIIDEFVLSGFKKLDEEEIAIVSSWKRAIHGKFIVDRHLRKGSVLISVDNNEVYVVKGIYSSWKEILGGYPIPQIVEATLMPFRDVITHTSHTKNRHIIGSYATLGI